MACHECEPCEDTIETWYAAALYHTLLALWNSV